MSKVSKSRVMSGLKKLMLRQTDSLKDAPVRGFRGEDFSLRGQQLYLLFDTYSGCCSQADSSHYRVYRDGIMKMNIHHYLDDAEVTGRTDFTLEQFEEHFDTLKPEHQKGIRQEVKGMLE